MLPAVASLLPLQHALPGAPLRRILMTTDTIGGVWTYAMELCRGLAGAGVEAVLATMGAPVSAAQRREAGRLPGLVLETGAHRLEWMPDAAADVERAGGWLLELERRHQPDLVHLNGYAHAALGWRAPVVIVAHSCVHTWWRAVHGGEPPSEFSHYTRRLREGLAAADRLVAPSAAFLRAFRAEHGRLPPAQVVPNGRDPAGFPPGPKEPFYLCVGRLWDEAKNAAALAAVAPRLPWPVRLAGDATAPDGRTAELPNVQQLGRCEPARVAQWMSRAAVYVLPARYEPFGLSVLEAALSGCALVLGDIPSLREIWGDAALYVPPADQPGLQRVLTWLARESDARADYAARARERAGTFTAAEMTRRYLGLYRTLLVERASAPARRTSLSA